MAAAIYLNVPIMIAAYRGCAALERRHLPQNKADCISARKEGATPAQCMGNYEETCQAKVNLNDCVELGAIQLLLSQSNFNKFTRN